MSGYESAPATRLLATHCAACGRPLLDAVSVEMGIGPVCREGAYPECLSPEVHAEANRIVHAVAIAQAPNLAGAARLRELGFEALADLIVERFVTVRIFEATADSDHSAAIRRGDVFLKVRTPYSDEATADWRAIPGRYWRKEEKVNAVPASQRKALWALLRRHFAGALAVGPKGPFTI